MCHSSHSKLHSKRVYFMWLIQDKKNAFLKNFSWIKLIYFNLRVKEKKLDRLGFYFRFNMLWKEHAISSSRKLWWKSIACRMAYSQYEANLKWKPTFIFDQTHSVYQEWLSNLFITVHYTVIKYVVCVTRLHTRNSFKLKLILDLKTTKKNFTFIINWTSIFDFRTSAFLCWKRLSQLI